MNVPRFLRRRRYITYRGELRDIVGAVARGSVAEGPGVAAFEEALSTYHADAHVATVNSGRVGLLILLESLGLRPGDEILVPAYTLRALIELLITEGYVPVPVDVEDGGFNMDPDHAAARVTTNTRAILATHLFGQACAIEALRDLAAEHRLLLIEDCAQALGTRVGEQKVGTFGDGCILSFDLLKTVNTFGGGAVLVHSEEAAARVRERVSSLAPDPGAVVKRIALGLVEHAVLLAPTAPLICAALAHPWTQPLIARSYRSMQSSMRPTDARFTHLQASIGARLLDSLDARVSVRRAMAARLSRALGEQPRSSTRGDNGYFFVRRVAGDPVALRRRLLLRGIDAGIGHEVADFCGDLGRADACPRALEAYESAIQLPLHEGLTDAQLDRIADACRGHLHPA